MRLSRIGAVVLAIALISACSESREEKYEKALRVAESAKKHVDSAHREVDKELKQYEKASAAAEAAEKRLAKARSKLESAEASAAIARADVAKWADDVTVFRSVQGRLLEAKALGDAAVTARVQDGVVYLEGRVESDSERKRAVQIARETPGVVDVQSQITVGSSAPTPSFAPAPAPAPEPAPESKPEPAPESTVTPEPAPVGAVPADPIPEEPTPSHAELPKLRATDTTPAPNASEQYWPDRTSLH